MWIFFAFLAPALYAVAEIFDEYLSNRQFKNISSVVFFASALNFIFAPVLFLIQRPEWPPVALILPLLGLALTNLLYQYPYYKALRVEDTSIVSGLFSLGKIILPIFAFLFVGEILSLKEYIGIGIIIIGNVCLSLHRSKKKFNFSKAFYLIIYASVILAIDGILFKYIFEQGLNWSTAVSGQLFLSGILGCSFFLLYSRTRKHIIEDKQKFRTSAKLFFTEELFTFLALAAETYAITLAPVSLVKGMGMVIPIFVLSYTIAVKKYAPKVFHEHTSRADILKKIAIFCFLILGLMLVGGQ